MNDENQTPKYMEDCNKKLEIEKTSIKICMAIDEYDYKLHVIV